jgi:hypothetical protein
MKKEAEMKCNKRRKERKKERKKVEWKTSRAREGEVKKKTILYHFLSFVIRKHSKRWRERINVS